MQESKSYENTTVSLDDFLINHADTIIQVEEIHAQRDKKGAAIKRIKKA
jgi:hypothetical protein